MERVKILAKEKKQKKKRIWEDKNIERTHREVHWRYGT